MAATKRTAAVAAGTIQNEPETAAGYKLLYGTFEKRNEAVAEITKCAKKGLKGYLALVDGRAYTILLGDYKTKEAAETAQTAAEVAGLKENKYTIKAM